MNKDAWTPGPWEVDSGMVQTKYEHQCKLGGCGVHIPIAYMDRKPGNGTMPVERDSNAQLIALTPEFVDTLRGLVAWQEIMGGWDALVWRKAEALLRAVNKIGK